MLSSYISCQNPHKLIFDFPCAYALVSSADTFKISGEWSIGGGTAGDSNGSGKSNGKNGDGGRSSSDGDKDATSVSLFLLNAWSSPLDQSTIVASSSSSAFSSSTTINTASVPSDVKVAAGGDQPLVGSGSGSGVNDSSSSSSSSLTTFRLAYLPNWWFSLALAAYNGGKMFSNR